MKKKVVVIGGGTGTFSVLSALRESEFAISAIVSTADDGGSTGILRDELGVLPPGDLRQALVALSSDSSVLRELFSYRFTEGSLAGHSFGNLLISALEKVTGRFDEAVIEAGKILAINGRVIPVTVDQMHLRAQAADGTVVDGEHNIEQHLWSEGADINRMWLDTPCVIHPLARQAIKEADLIVIAPGSIFTSLIPNLLVEGVREALHASKAKIAYICNLMTEKGQTGSFSVQDFAGLIERYLGEELDYVIHNTKSPSKELLERYKKEMERTPVKLDRSRTAGYRLIGADLLGTNAPVPTASDRLAATRTLIRHEPKKLARVLVALTYLNEAERYLTNA
jgi:uncharacterized cofD-like protein